MAFSMMGGFWALELKHAGDKVILRVNRTGVHLIHDDKVEIRDAAHLRGKGSGGNHR
jgi:benzoyl-CoA reductase subunit BamB